MTSEQVYPVAKLPAPQKILGVPAYFPSIVVAKSKDGTVLHKPVETLNRWPFWTPNAHKSITSLVVDIDRDDALMTVGEVVGLNAPKPNYFVERPNGHCQVGYFIHPVPTGPHSRRAPQNYARDVLVQLRGAYQGDPDFTNTRCRNPYWSEWGGTEGTVTWMNDQLWRLGELRSALVDASLWEHQSSPRGEYPSPTASSPDDLSTANGRNHWVFDRIRLRGAGTAAEAGEVAQQRLAAFGRDRLPDRELAQIVRNVERWEAVHGPPWLRRVGANMTEEQRAAKAAQGRRGGTANTDAQKRQRQAAQTKATDAASVLRAARAVGRAAEARALREAGYTVAETANHLGVTTRTVYRLLKV